MELAELTDKIEKTQRYFLNTNNKKEQCIYAKQLKILNALLTREKTYIKQNIIKKQLVLFK
jgi:hypothetical protein